MKRLGARPAPPRPAICYVVPSWSPDDASHMAHLPRLLAAIGAACDLHVIVQHASGCPQIPNAASVQIQRPGNHLRRGIELLQLAWRLRARGCRRFFVRISASAALELGILGRLAGLQVYYWVSGQGDNLRPPWRTVGRRLAHTLGQWLIRVNIRLAHRLVTGPEKMVDYYAHQLGAQPTRTTVLYNDVAIPREAELLAPGRARAALGLAADTPVVLFVGRVSPLKGGRRLVAIATRLASRCPAARLLVVGSLAHLPEVPAEAHRRGLRNLEFRGPVPNHALAAYYRAADVLILPSESEGFPRVLLEAMAHGVPVVAFDVGGVTDIVHPVQRRLVVPRGDVEALVAGVESLLADPAVRAAQARAGRLAVERFSTERVARMFVERVAAGAA
jgi:glycosyltransferase involved in cell wall biosynthesis